MVNRGRVPAAAAVILVGAVAAWANSYGRGPAPSLVRIVHLTYVFKHVELRAPAPSHAWGKALANAPLVQSDALRTQAGSVAEVQLECGSELRLAPNSQFSFPQLSLSSKGTRQTAVKVSRGTAFFTLRKKDTAAFQVLIPGGVVRASNHTASFRVDVPGPRAADIELLDGHASVTAGNQTWPLEKKKRLELAAHQPPRWTQAPPPDILQKWSQKRDYAFARELAEAKFNANQVLSYSPMIGTPAAAAPPPPPGQLSGASDEIGQTITEQEQRLRLQSPAALLPACALR